QGFVSQPGYNRPYLITESGELVIREDARRAGVHSVDSRDSESTNEIWGEALICPKAVDGQWTPISNKFSGTYVEESTTVHSESTGNPQGAAPRSPLIHPRSLSIESGVVDSVDSRPEWNEDLEGWPKSVRSEVREVQG